MKKIVADESRYDPDTVTNTKVKVTPDLLKWWDTLNQYQKTLYCEIHPQSDLTLGHMGKIIFDGWDKAKMKQYHQEQARDLKINMMSCPDPEERIKLKRLYQKQLALSEK